MKSARRRAREAVVQGLYHWQLTQESVPFIEQTLRETEHFERADVRLFESVLRGVMASQPVLDEALLPHVSRDLASINPVERGVLWMAAWEMLNAPDTPLRVIINEAIEVAKTFGGPDGHRFVNGVLDRLGGTLRPLEAKNRPV